MLNNVTLIGRITKDIELRHTQAGKAVTQFTLAVQERKDVEADYIDCVAWEKTAENMSTYLRKGSLIAVNGKLKKRSYEDSNGRKIYVTEVVADRVVFLESKPKEEETPVVKDPFTVEDLPF